MKRRWIMLKLLVFLLLGAIVNVAVAWGCVTFPAHAHLVQASPHVAGEHLEWWRETAPSAMKVPETTLVWAARGRDVTVLGEHGTSWAEESVRISAGIPLRTASAYWFIDPLGPREYRRVLRLALRGDTYFLPTQPLSPGVAINTIFYAAIVWLLFAVPEAVRRRVRRKRGQCVKCAYDLRGRGTEAETCPECGATA